MREIAVLALSIDELYVLMSASQSARAAVAVSADNSEKPKHKKKTSRRGDHPPGGGIG
jgi:hypothetical protein